MPIKYKSSLCRLNLGSSRSLSHVLNKGSSSPTFLPSPCTHLTRMLNAPGGLLLDLLPLNSERQHRGKDGITLMRLPSHFQHSSHHTPDYVDNSKHCRKKGIYLCDSAKEHLAHLLTQGHLVQMNNNNNEDYYLKFPSKPRNVRLEKEIFNLEGEAWQNKEELKYWFNTSQQATLMTDTTTVSLRDSLELTP